MAIKQSLLMQKAAAHTDPDSKYTIEDFFKEGKAAEKGITADDVDPEQLAMGIEVEKEHTKDIDAARKISLDHLAEIKNYYTRLKKMEDEAKAEMDTEGTDDTESSKEAMDMVDSMLNAPVD